VSDFARRWKQPEILEAIFDQLSDAIFLYDRKFQLVGINKSAEEFFGLPPAQMLGKPCWELFRVTSAQQTEPVPPEMNLSWALPTGSVTLDIEKRGMRKVIIRTIELLDEAGELEGIVAIVTDVTAQLAPESQPSVNGFRIPAQLVHLSQNLRALAAWIPRNRNIVLGAGLLLIVMALFATMYLPANRPLSPEEKMRAAEKAKHDAIATFEAMTPAQHLERARLDLKSPATPANIADGLRHLKAIPASSPEASARKALERELLKARSLASAQGLIDSAGNSDPRDGLDKVQRADTILEAVRAEYPHDKDAAKLSAAERSVTEQLALRSPEDFAAAALKLVEFSWQKGGFGTVMIGNFTIRNNSLADLADLCSLHRRRCRSGSE